MSACAACGVDPPARPLRAACCGSSFCGRCVAPRACAAAPCAACGAPLRKLDAGDAAESAGTEARRVRYGHAELRLDVRTGAGETTHERCAALFDIPSERLTLVSAGRKLKTEAEARAAPLLLAIGTVAGAHLPRISAWRRALRWCVGALARGAAAAPSATRAGALVLHALCTAAGVAREFVLSMLLPSRAPPLAPPPPPAHG